MTGVFQEIKNALTIDEAFQFYDFSVNRAGYICCPIHGERTPSLKIYSKENRWHCFGCGRGGSVIDFVSTLYNLSPLDACKKLDMDFHLGLFNSTDNRVTRRQIAEAEERRKNRNALKQFDEWREKFAWTLASCYNRAYRALNDKPCTQWDDGEAKGVVWLEYIDSLIDELYGQDEEAIMQIFRRRAELGKLCSEILNSTI